MAQIRISKPLQQLTEGRQNLFIDCDSYFNLYTNLTNLFPNLRKHSKEIAENRIVDLWLLVNDRLITPEELFLPVPKNKIVTLVPIISGGGDNVLPIFAGLALIAFSLAVLAPIAGAAAAAAATSSDAIVGISGVASFLAGAYPYVLGAGIAITLNGVMSLLNQPSKPAANISKPTDASTRANNDAFGPLQNTINTGTPIPLIFGQFRVPGQLISGRIKTINHDASTVVSVANYV